MESTAQGRAPVDSKSLEEPVKRGTSRLRKVVFYLGLANPLVSMKTRVCRAYGPRVEEDYDLLEESQWWSAKEQRAYQAEKLRRLVRYVYQKVPYYREVLRDRNLAPGDVREVEDLAALPILNKQIIRKQQERLLSGEFSSSRVSLARTGASTGEPLVFYLDKVGTDLAWGAFLRFARWMGYEWGDRIALFWRTPDAFKRQGAWYQNLADWLRVEHVMNLELFDAFRLGHDQLGAYVERLIGRPPGILRGYPSAILLLANYCMNHGIPPVRPKAITTTAEPLFTPERKLLEAYYGCGVFDHYGCGEVYSIAYECEHHLGLHVTTEHCIVEIVDDEGRPAEPGRKGRIVVTDLDNYMMPFIRYENGDVGSLRTTTCRCGRGLPLMDHVDGRVFGLIRGLNGNVVHGEFFADLLQNLGWYENYGLIQFEIVQHTVEGFDCSFICSRRPAETAVEAFRAACRQSFGAMSINVAFVDHIPETAAGKRRNTRSMIDPLRGVARQG